jgi:predicted nucleotidyltransferase
MDTPVQTKGKTLALIEEHQDRIKALGVKKLGLFGFFVREEQGMESDIDLPERKQ